MKDHKTSGEKKEIPNYTGMPELMASFRPLK